MTDVVITAAKRTPVGSFLGHFATTPAHELGRVAIEAALQDAGIDPADVEKSRSSPRAHSHEPTRGTKRCFFCW